MSLSFSFQLTPRQTEMLLIMAFGHYKNTNEEHGPKIGPLPDLDSPHFVTTGGRLIDKGLIDHDNNREPTWMPTARGIEVAKIIADDARKIVALADTAKPLPKVTHKKQVKK